MRNKKTGVQKKVAQNAKEIPGDPRRPTFILPSSKRRKSPRRSS
jgi:hypothetical protein